MDRKLAVCLGRNSLALKDLLNKTYYTSRRKIARYGFVSHFETLLERREFKATVLFGKRSCDFGWRASRRSFPRRGCEQWSRAKRNEPPATPAGRKAKLEQLHVSASPTYEARCSRQLRSVAVEMPSRTAISSQENPSARSSSARADCATRRDSTVGTHAAPVLALSVAAW